MFFLYVVVLNKIYSAFYFFAVCISFFISFMACSRPMKMDWAMMLWPMLSSMMLGIAAMGWMFW